MNGLSLRGRSLAVVSRFHSRYITQIPKRRSLYILHQEHSAKSVGPLTHSRCFSQAMLFAAKTPGGNASKIVAAASDEAPFQLSVIEHQLIDSQREVLRKLLGVIESIDEASHRDVRLLREEIERLGDGFFLLVVAGEYNSGKSSLINALAGRKVLDEGPTPTTAQVTKLKYSDSSFRKQASENDIVVLGEPLSFLTNRMQIVDTPGTNAIDRAHESLTRDYIPICDLVLFVTSADRPFSESERLFLESIRQWGKKVVLVINKMDLLALDNSAATEVVEFVTTAAKTLVGSTPQVFPVSSRLALDAKQALTDSYESDLKESGLHSLEHYMQEKLDSKEKFKVKLEASTNVGNTILNKYERFLHAGKAVVGMDQAAIAEIEKALERYSERVKKGFSAHYARVDNALLHMLDRADIFFDSNIRISNVTKLLQKDAMKHNFEVEVIANTTKNVQRQAEAMAEWLTDMSSRSISETSSIFARRLGERSIELLNIVKNESEPCIAESLKADTLISRMDLSKAEDALISGLSAAACDLARNYDAINDGRRIANEVSSSVRTALTLEAGAVGLLSVLLGTSSLDVTGVTSTGVLASAGLVILPRRRLALRHELRSRLGTLRTRLQKDLETRVDEHVASHRARIRDAMEPFSKFTTSKRKDIDAYISALEISKQDIAKVRRNLVNVHSELEV